MLHTLINLVAGVGRNKLRNTLLCGVVLAGVPAAAFARHRDFRFDVIVPVPPVFVVPEPRCDPAPRRVWIEPVYQTVTERVWVPATIRTEMQHVEVPAQYGYRDMSILDGYGRAHIRRVTILISPARCEDRQVETVVCEGHFEQQPHQQLVCEGHWQDVPQPRFERLDIPLPF